jgi:DNA repair exonuclease SbcCD ATPase subunit
MNKLCLPLLTLALGLPSLAHARDDKLPRPADAGIVKTSLTASASASGEIKISDQDALNDDILSVIDLPVVAADAREAGIEEPELKEALDTTRDSGLSASDASDVVATEAEQTRKRGVKRGFGRWVKMQVAAGLRGQKLAAKIKERKQDTAELDEKQLADLREKLEKQREMNKNWRRSQLAKRGELVAKGKKPVLMHKERHDQLKAKIDAAQGRIDGAQDRLDGKQDETATRLKALEEKIAAASDADKPALEAEKLRLEKELGKLEKREDKLEKREDKLEEREDKLEKREDKREEKREEKAEHHEGKGKPGHAGGHGDKPKAAGDAK